MKKTYPIERKELEMLKTRGYARIIWDEDSIKFDFGLMNQLKVGDKVVIIRDKRLERGNDGVILYNGMPSEIIAIESVYCIIKYPTGCTSVDMRHVTLRKVSETYFDIASQALSPEMPETLDREGGEEPENHCPECGFDGLKNIQLTDGPIVKHCPRCGWKEDEDVSFE